MAGAARRLGNRHHRAVQRADTRSAAVVRLRSQAAHRDRSRYRRRDAGFNALAVLKSVSQLARMTLTQSIFERLSSSLAEIVAASAIIRRNAPSLRLKTRVSSSAA